jgi:DNA-binding transcriptional regulator YdaS (Cro superfamily)
MKLPEYIAAHETYAALAERVGLTRGALYNIGVGRRECSNSIGAAIERETGGQVTQRELAETRLGFLKAKQRQERRVRREGAAA